MIVDPCNSVPAAAGRNTGKSRRGVDAAAGRAWFVVAGVLAWQLVACSTADDPSVPTRRALDAAPVKTRLTPPLPQGRAEAFFQLDTGADQMTQRPKEAGLVLIIRTGADEYRQTIASCRDPGLGSALGGGTERELEVAVCDGEYWLISEPGSVSVMRMDRKPGGEPITRFSLPGNVRAARPRDE